MSCRSCATSVAALSLSCFTLLLGCDDPLRRTGAAGPGGSPALPEPDAGTRPAADGPRCSAQPFAPGGPGHADPLGASAGQARAGRVTAGQLPPVASGLITWAPGDWVLANDRVAVVIEDVGDSDLYDPWGGRPVGFALVRGGRLVAPADFGEFFLLTGRSTVLTTSVSVIADGSDGGPAIIRASGRLAPIPFYDSLTRGLVSADGFEDIEAALDYVLAPGSDVVEVVYRYRSPRAEATRAEATLHGFMFAPRAPMWMPDIGFQEGIRAPTPWVAFIDDLGASWAYRSPTGPLGGGVSASGFVAGLTDGFDLGACGQEEHHTHARLAIGGPGLDGLVQTLAKVDGTQLRLVSGTVKNADGSPAVGARVHAESGAKPRSRAFVSDSGAFELHVPATEAITLTAYRRGDVPVKLELAPAGQRAELTFPPAGLVHVVVRDTAGAAIPARIQLLPAAGQDTGDVPGRLGEPEVSRGRLHVEYANTGEVTMRAPAGRWEVVASHGYEYELLRQTVDVPEGGTVEASGTLAHVVATPNIQCGDFHIHTRRSNDSGDDARQKLRSAVADGLELPVRSEHEFVAGFEDEIAAEHLEAWAFGPASIEMTSMELWGHMGVFPLAPDATRPNGGAPLWQKFPTHARPDVPLETLSPKVVFDQVRARPELPAIIINHPRGPTNYFDYVGFNPVTGMVDRPGDWDTQFTLVEVFNDNDWNGAQDRVRDWLALNRGGRRVFAVGSSDSHGISSSPVGYPRTCITLGTDDPRQLTGDRVRDGLTAGHVTISGGLYLSADVIGAGPGDFAAGGGARQMVNVTLQGASWIDADFVEILVDGEVVQKLEISASDADPANPAIRFRRSIPIDIAPMGSFVIVAAYGDRTLEPVHPGRRPFAATNPIFVMP